MKDIKDLIITKQENLSPKMVEDIKKYMIKEQKRLYSEVKINERDKRESSKN